MSADANKMHASLAEHLAASIRNTRVSNGLSRLELADLSGISERYLAQLETAAANPSLTMLVRLGVALNLNLIQLLGLLELLNPLEQEEIRDQLDSRVTRRRMGAALLGLRGAGKSTLGSRLSKQIGWPLVKLGSVIEEVSRIPIDELYSLGGQAAITRIETRAVLAVIENWRQPIVLEVGGGLVMNQGAYSLIRQHFLTIWLRAEPEEHMDRVIAQGDLRPMSGNDQAMEDLKAILRERDSYYRMAEHHLSTSHRTIDDCLQELANLVATMELTR